MSSSATSFRTKVAAAVEMAGSQVALARLMGRSQQQVSALCNYATGISAEDAIAIHRATSGKISASELRPDLWNAPENVPSEPAGERA